MKRLLLLSSLMGCMLMGQAFATQDDADHLIIVEQMPVDKELLLDMQLEQICDETSQEATASLTKEAGAEPDSSLVLGAINSSFSGATAAVVVTLLTSADQKSPFFSMCKSCIVLLAGLMPAIYAAYCQKTKEATGGILASMVLFL